MCDEVGRERRQIMVFGDYETKKVPRKRHGRRHKATYTSIKKEVIQVKPYNFDDMETFPDEGELPIVKIFCNGNSRGEIVGQLMSLVAKIRGEFSEEESKIFSDGLDVLMKNLGPSGMINFVQILSPGYGDYTKERQMWDGQ